MYIKLYINKNIVEDKINIHSIDSFMNINDKENNNYIKIRRFEEIFKKLNNYDIKYNNIKLYLDDSTINLFNLNSEEGYLQYLEKAKIQKYNKIPLESLITIDGFVLGGEINNYSYYSIKVEGNINKRELTRNYVNILMDSPYTTTCKDLSLLGELHGILRLLVLAMNNNKSIDIYYSNKKIKEILNEKYIPTSDTNMINDFKNQFKNIMMELERRNTYKKNYERRNINFYYIEDYIDNSSIIYNKDGLYKNIINLKNDLFNKDNYKYEDPTELKPTALCNRLRGFYINNSNAYRNIKYEFTGEYLYLLYKNNNFNNKLNHLNNDITDEEFIMLLLMSPDIIYMINKRLIDYKEKFIKKLNPAKNIEHIKNSKYNYDTEAMYNVDYLVTLILNKAKFLITGEYGLCRHGVINISEALPIINKDDKYCLLFIINLISKISKINNHFCNDFNHYTSEKINVTITDNSYKLITKNEPHNNNFRTENYTVYIYSYGDKEKNIIRLY